MKVDMRRDRLVLIPENAAEEMYLETLAFGTAAASTTARRVDISGQRVVFQVEIVGSRSRPVPPSERQHLVEEVKVEVKASEATPKPTASSELPISRGRRKS